MSHEIDPTPVGSRRRADSIQSHASQRNATQDFNRKTRPDQERHQSCFSCSQWRCCKCVSLKCFIRGCTLRIQESQQGHFHIFFFYELLVAAGRVNVLNWLLGCRLFSLFLLDLTQRHASDTITPERAFYLHLFFPVCFQCSSLLRPTSHLSH